MTRSIRISVLVLAMVAAACAPNRSDEMKESSGDVAITDAGTNLKTAMRKLWSDHVVWTRQYIVAATADDPSAAAAAARLMKNQEDLGNAIVPYYGSEAGTKLTDLLKQHINIAVDLVAAAKAKDNTKLGDADKRWHDNATEIATFLSGANPNWSKDGLVTMLNEHLSLTTEEAKARLEKRWDDDARTFDRIFDQAMHMADALADGIVKQFPDKF
jgi:hypothetical protein